ncbi:crossover junction endodeoxyribonuclease RuvC [uncultured Pseudoteredinibacter sp.]|uniref:crossover junction endodeoxyribonuclease RuvC n=1 Tax=uncultured Pseudoteredinibacter sp. TaxID=1641701 RepID=UPI0026059E36|nr:crossover junction endodeoxyribonuclease RuvC [uncultured Pseudoteredinibacter sp.]
MSRALRVLGIDPGSLKTGFGVIDVHGSRNAYVSSGVIRLPADRPLPERLKIIFDSMLEVIDEYRPAEIAVEQVFMSKSAGSALKLGQARGAAIVAGTFRDIPIAEYEAKKVKQSVVGSGAADKQQMQHMTKTLLKLSDVPQEDAADALAVALCHINSRRHFSQLGDARQYRRGRVV